MRYGKQPIPKTKREFIAALKRAEAKAFRQAASALRAHRSQPVMEFVDSFENTARSRDEDAVDIEKIDPTHADADSRTAALYEEATRGIWPR